MSQSSPSPSGRFTAMDAASLAGLAGMAALTLAVWKWGSAGPLPLHFNLQGVADRYGDRGEVARDLALMTGAAGALSGLLILLARVSNGQGWRESLKIGRGLVVLGMAFASLTLGGIALGWAGGIGGPQHWTMAGMGLLFFLIGAVIGKLRPNPIAGVRTYWTLTSRLAWDKANRLAGRLFVIIGVATLLAAPFAPMPLGLMATTGAVLVAAAWSVLESFRVWLIDPDRKGRT